GRWWRRTSARRRRRRSRPPRRGRNRWPRSPRSTASPGSRRRSRAVRNRPVGRGRPPRHRCCSDRGSFSTYHFLHGEGFTDDPNVRVPTGARSLVTLESMGTGQGRSLTLNSAFRVGFTGTLGVGLAIAVMMSLQSVSTIIIFFALAQSLSLGLEPIVPCFVDRKEPRSLSVILVTLAFTLIVVGAGLLAAPIVISQIQTFFDGLPDIVANFAAAG